MTSPAKRLNEQIRNLIEHDEVGVIEALVITWKTIQYHHARIRLYRAQINFQKRSKKLQDAVDPIQFRLQMTDM